MKIEITKAQAEAIHADIVEITHLQELVKHKMAHNKRLIDMIARDASVTPGSYIDYRLLEGGDPPYLDLVEDQRPVPVNRTGD